MAFADEMQYGRCVDLLFVICLTSIIALPFYLFIYWRGIDDRGIVFLVLSVIVACFAIRRDWKNVYEDGHDFKVFCSWPVSKRCLYVFLGLCLCTVASLIIYFIYWA